MERKDITLHVAPEALMALALILEMKLDEWEEDPQKELYLLMPDLIDEFKYTIDEMSKQGTLASKIFGKNREIHPTKITFSSENGQHVFYPAKDLPVVDGWHILFIGSNVKIGVKGQKLTPIRIKQGKLVPQDTDMNDVYKTLLIGAGFTYYKIKDDLLDITGKGSQPITGCSIEWGKSDFYDQTNL
ncbi:hypothetical protein [Butyricimonas synergistica]|nr:hypothetical protein [Butyricimonas synergistica]